MIVYPAFSISFKKRTRGKGAKNMVCVQNTCYELVEDFRNGFNEEAFKARYADILTKYDYIVGDWGYDQLRLRGFFEDHHKNVPYDSKISTLREYIYEYCNFGCRYFVVKKVKAS